MGVVMLWTIFTFLLLFFINAYQSVNGAGIIHWVALIVGIMGMTAITTTLIYQTWEELS